MDSVYVPLVFLRVFFSSESWGSKSRGNSVHPIATILGDAVIS